MAKIWLNGFGAYGKPSVRNPFMGFRSAMVLALDSVLTHCSPKHAVVKA